MSATPVIGNVYSEHVVPPGAVIVFLKYCESCGVLFQRRGCDRHCFRCHANPVPLGKNELQASIEELIAREQPLAL
jgi:hypothetical protein